MHNRALLIAVLSAGLGLSAASAQNTTTTTATPTAPASFSDVPAGSYAKDAVDFITQRGLIIGFPDGTFRGNEPLTRYQAALIFYRLLQSGQLSNMSAQDQATVTRGIQEVSTELASIATRVGDVERASADQQARIAALEQQIQSAGAAATTTTATTNTALEQRVAALETAVQALQTAQATPATPAPSTDAATIADLQARIATLEQRLAAQPAPTTPATTPTTTTPATTDNGVAVNPGTGTTVVVTDTGVTGPIVTAPTTYLGISANYAFGNSFNFGALKYGATLGTTSLFGGFGGRATVEYQPSNGALNGDLSLTYNLNIGFLNPYVGVGAGLAYSANQDGSGASAIDYYVNGLVGSDFNLTDTIGLFAEVNPRYYFSNNGVGTSLATGATGGFNIGARAGLKFFF